MNAEQRIAKRASDIPVSHRGLYLRAVAGKCSPRQAIKAKCAECMGWEGVAEYVRNCTSPTCPLYPLRPFRPSGGKGLSAPERSEGPGPAPDTPHHPETSPERLGHSRVRLGENANPSGSNHNITSNKTLAEFAKAQCKPSSASAERTMAGSRSPSRRASRLERVTTAQTATAEQAPESLSQMPADAGRNSL